VTEQKFYYCLCSLFNFCLQQDTTIYTSTAGDTIILSFYCRKTLKIRKIILIAGLVKKIKNLKTFAIF